MTAAPPPIMPLPRRASPPSRVYRYLVASLDHAHRLFGAGTLLHARAVDALTREAGAAVIVESLGGTTVATMPLANGHEVAAALAGVPGAVTFALRNQPAVEACEAMADCGPPSRDPSLAAVEVEVVRLRKVEEAARALLASLPRCEEPSCARPATLFPLLLPGGWSGLIRTGVRVCADHSVLAPLRMEEGPQGAAIRALEALLAPVSEAASST